MKYRRYDACQNSFIQGLGFLLYVSTAFSFMTEVPKELDIVKNIDYDVQFEKSFVEPLKFITEKINWSIDNSYGTQGNLLDFL